MRATKRNMRLCEDRGIPNVVAFSPETGEIFSATPDDYFMRPDDWCMKDSQGNDMELVREIHTVAMERIDESEVNP